MALSYLSNNALELNRDSAGNAYVTVASTSSNLVLQTTTSGNVQATGLTINSTQDTTVENDLTVKGTITSNSSGPHVFGTSTSKITLAPNETAALWNSTNANEDPYLAIQRTNGGGSGLAIEMDDDDEARAGGNNSYAFRLRTSDVPTANTNANTKFNIGTQGHTYINYGATVNGVGTVTDPHLAVNGNAFVNGTVEATAFTGALTGTVDGVDVGAHVADTLGVHGSTSASTANTIVERNGSGDINARLFRSEYDVTNATVNYIMTQIDTASNNYMRPTTPAQFRTAVTDGSYVSNSSPDTITYTDNNANANFTGLLIDHNASGTTALTADRAHRGLHIDMDNSATGGDTSNEHRVYGISSDVYSTGDSDLQYGGYFYARAVPSAGTTVSSLVGAQGYARADASGSGDIANTYGVHGVAYAHGSSATSTPNLYGVYGLGQCSGGVTAGAPAIPSVTGVLGEVQFDATAQTPVDVTNAYAVRAVYDENDAENDWTVTNGYLFHGDYQGQLPTNAWGVYIVDNVKSFFGGDVQTNGVFDGTATAAQYADLAEKYTADSEIESGTVVCFGGEEEVTICDHDHDRKVAGVVSTQPAYLMNSTSNGVAVALRGRVPCKVIGPINKGDALVSAGNGMARAEADPHHLAVIGKALDNYNGEGPGIIEVVVG